MTKNPPVRDCAPALPRLVYVADVPVESFCHGSTLMFRLLEDYPRDRLLIIESSLQQSMPQRRLDGVAYRTLGIGFKRILETRFNLCVSSAYLGCAASRWRKLARLADDLQPEAVLTVAHGYSWLAAVKFARMRRLPLHLVIHDDWPNVTPMIRMMHSFWERRFATSYRSAATRFCVSPFMEERYRKQYRAPGTLLYPSRSRSAAGYEAPPTRLGESTGSLTGLYAGTINSGGQANALRGLAKALESFNGRLLHYGPASAEQLISLGLDRPNIVNRGLLSSPALIAAARKEAEFLVVPVSPDPGDLAAMEINFPSKLTDYTAMGLPLLITGPPSCSAVRWARENPGSAEVVCTDSASELLPALQRLCDPARRMALAATAIQLGNSFFSHEKAYGEFLRHVTAPHSARAR